MRNLACFLIGFAIFLVSLPSYANEVQDNALVLAAKQGNLAAVKEVLATGAHVDATNYSLDQHGLQAIHYATIAGNAELMKVLLNAGAQINAIDYSGMQPIHYAVINGNLKLVNYVLGVGADVNAANKNGEQPLHLAASSGNAEIVNALIKSGANLEARNSAGLTPIFNAAIAGQINVVKILLNDGAKPNPTDAYGNQLIKMLESGDQLVQMMDKNHKAAEIAKVLRAAENHSTRVLIKQQSMTVNSNVPRQSLLVGFQLPGKVADYFINPTGTWRNGNPYDGKVSISKLAPNLYGIDYTFQNPIDYGESGRAILMLTNCLANHIAEMTQSKGWDIGHERDMFDRNFGRPFSALDFLILTGVKDDETREHATGRETLQWTYGDILSSKDLRYANSYPSVVGECKKLLKPEYSTYIAPNNTVYINGKALPTRLWALVNADQQQQNSVDWDSMKNATINYKVISPRLLKIQFEFDEPVNNMYMLSMSFYAGCIGSYMAPRSEYEVFALGSPQNMQTVPPGGDSSSLFEFYTLGLNSGDDIVKLSNNESIRWLASPSKEGIRQMKVASINMAKVCPKLVRSIYVDEGRK